MLDMDIPLFPSEPDLETSWALRSFSTCSVDGQLASWFPNRGRGMPDQMPETKGLRTQSFLQGLHVAPLRPALPPDLVIGASVAKTCACAAARLDAIALQFPLPANHARQTLWLGHARVAPRGSLHRDVVFVVDEVVGRVRHHDGVGRRLG